MASSLDGQTHLDLDGLLQSSLRLEKLASRLPADAVQSLANEVVARLSANLHSSSAGSLAPTPEPIEQLCRALLSNDPYAGAAMISRLGSEKTSAEDIYTLYLTAAARRLGEMWEADEISFAEVTIGASRILAIMRELRETFRPKRPLSDRAALFAAVPGEQHTIGITMAADLLRREGWDIDLLVGATHEEIIEVVVGTNALVVGLTAHGAQSLAALFRLVFAIRIVNPVVHVLVCGNIVEEAEDILALTWADGYARDIPSPALRMEELRLAVRGSPASG